MEVPTAIAFNQAPDMGFELVNKLMDIIKGTRAQDSRNLWAYPRQQLVNSRMHSQIRVSHEPKKLEGSTVR